MNKYEEIKENFLDSIQESIKNINSFKNLPLKFKKDPNFVTEVLKLVHTNESYVGQYEDLVPEIIKDLNINKETALILVNSHGYLLCKLPQNLKDDEDVVLAAIKNYSYSLIYCSKEIKDNKKIVLEAVNLRADLLESVSKRLCADEEVVMAAVKKDGSAINYANPDLWSNKSIMLEAAKTYMNILEYLGENLIGDKEIALAAYKCNKFAYEKFSKELKQEIIDNNIEEIIPYLESTILVEKLQSELSDSKPQAKKIKI